MKLADVHWKRIFSNFRMNFAQYRNDYVRNILNGIENDEHRSISNDCMKYFYFDLFFENQISHIFLVNAIRRID